VHVTRAFSAPPHGCLPHFCVWSPPGARLEPWSHSCTPRFRTPLKPLLRPRDTCRARHRPLSCCPPAVLPRLGPLPRAWCLRGPSCCGLLATKLSASAAIKEVVIPPHTRHSRRRPPWTLSPLCFRSCSLAQPSEAPNPFLLHHLSSPCCLCPSRAAPLAGAESSAAAATARLHWRTLCPNRALKSIAGEPLGLPHLFPSQVQRSPRRNCGCTAVG
jgi:hypothetical protein